jgi:transaldolase
MEIWLDTCNIQAIKAACRYGIIFGITTNPSILSKAGVDPEAVINKMLDEQDGPVAVQVVADKAEEIIHQALKLHSISERIIVKVPVTQQGFISMKALSEHEVPIMATAVYNPNQALLAGLTGANYLAPYVGRMYSSGIDAIEALQSIKVIYDHYKIETHIIAAALQSPEQITVCAKMGIHAVTLKESLFNQFMADDSCTLESLEGFTADWELNKKSSFLSGK